MGSFLQALMWILWLYLTQHVVRATIPNLHCSDGADIVFMVDNSNISSPEYRLEVDFVNDIMKHLANKSSEFDAAVVVYEHQASVELNFTGTFKLDRFISAMDQLASLHKFVPSLPRIDTALQVTLESAFNRNEERNVPKIIVLLSQGPSFVMDQFSLRNVSSSLNKKGVRVLVVGVGEDINQELYNITEGLDDMILVNNNFSSLLKYKDILVEKICLAADNPSVIFDKNHISPFVGMRQILTCHVTDISSPTVTWLRSGIVLRDGDLNGTIRIRNNVVSGAFGERIHELLLDTVQLEHSGNYTCEARNKYHARRRNIVVTASCPPSLPTVTESLTELLPTSLQSRMKGQPSLTTVDTNATLVCKAKNVPHLTSHLYAWKWEFRGKELRQNEKHIMVYEISPPNSCGQSEGWTALFVTNVSILDLGQYSCSLVRLNVTLGKTEAHFTGDPCRHSPCNGGKCIATEHGDSYKCACAEGFYGGNCEKGPVEHCAMIPVGVSDPRIIPDNRMTASSQDKNRCRPANGRLNGTRGDGWCTVVDNSTTDWLQVDMGTTIQVCAVATQGDVNGDEWTTVFKLSYSSDEKNWTTYKDFNGTDMEFHRKGNSETTDYHILLQEVAARYIRFHPIKQESQNCLRVEVYGAKAVLPNSSSPNETPVDEYSLSLTIEVKPTRKEPRKIPATLVTTKPSKIPRRIGAMPSISPARRNGVAYNDVHACPHECLPEGTEIVLPRVYNCTMDRCRMIPLGVSGPSKIPDRNITASSQYSPSYIPAYGRLNGTRGDGWCSSVSNSTFDWLQVDLGKIYPLCAVATQGDVNGNEWTVSFRLFFSSDGTIWRTYRNANGTEMEFHRKGGSGIVVQNTLPLIVPTRLIRFQPTKQHAWNCLRVEVYSSIGDSCRDSPCNRGNCIPTKGGKSYKCACAVGYYGEKCEKGPVERCAMIPVGVSDPRIIHDNQMTASSEFDGRCKAAYGRLNDFRGDGWCTDVSDSTTDWLQVDLGTTIQVCAVATQGDVDSDEWTTVFKLSYSSDENNWTTYKDANDTDMEFHRSGGSRIVVQHTLPLIVFTRYIRFYPIKQHKWNCLRVEVYSSKALPTTLTATKSPVKTPTSEGPEILSVKSLSCGRAIKTEWKWIAAEMEIHVVSWVDKEIRRLVFRAIKSTSYIFEELMSNTEYRVWLRGINFEELRYCDYCYYYYYCYRCWHPKDKSKVEMSWKKIQITTLAERPKKFAVEASPFACGVKLSWKTPNSGGCPITQYTVHYKESRDPVTEASSIWQVQNLNNTDRHNLMTDCNKEYKIIVLAWNERGHSDLDEDSVLTVFTDKGKPRTPLLKDIVPEKCGVVNVSWDPPPDESKSRPVASYEAEVGLDNYTWNNCITTSEKRSCQFRGLLKAGKYPVRVRALNPQGPSLWSKGFIALNASDRPEIPEIINTETSTPGCNVTLKWARPPSSGCPILFYTVRYSKVESEGLFRKWTTINTTNAEVNLLELSLNCTTSYEFKVKAWNALGSSETYPNAWPIRTGGSQLRKDSEAGSSPSSGLPQDDNRNLFIIVACVVSFAALVVTVVTYIRYRKRKKKPGRRVKRTVNDVKVLEICEVPPIRTSFIEELGEGAFGKVHKALHQDALEFFKCQHVSSRNRRKQIVAVKELHDNATDERRREFLAEIELMKKVGKHQNVLSFLGCWTTTKPLLLITEYVAHGDLRQWLIRKRSQICANMETSGDRATLTSIERTSYVFYDMAGAKDDHEMIVVHQNREFSTSSEQDKQSDLEEEEVHVPYVILSESEEEGDVTDSEKDDECDEDCESFYPSDLMSFAWQIARGMDFLSQKGLVHRDLAARNVLVGHGKLLKIADFGLMRQVYRDIYEIKNQKKLPIKWMAPESIFEQVFTVKSDIWSFGIVLWEVATIGGTPYPLLSNAELVRLLRSGYRMEKPDLCSDDVYSLMTACWEENHDERPSFQDLVTRLEQLMLQEVEYFDFNLVDASKDYYQVQESTEPEEEEDEGTIDTPL